ncbi:polysaccharide lyase family 7 protein [Polaribacter sp.]|uniref:polysaccharide lyase family 7 protein n=1 Tax=Polaribacter sp. TaxID=1920175 RepID=UPI0040487D5B
MKFKKIVFLLVYIITSSFFSCESFKDSNDEAEEETIVEEIEKFADINFSNWKVTLPVDENNNGSPDEYQPNQLVNGGYRNITAVKPFMYDDVLDKSIVFYTFPSTTTSNSSFSRTELRELINPTNSKINWTIDTGGEMKGRLKMMEISKDNATSSRVFHRTIFMQIHGVISISDMNSYGFSSNNGPPLLKMYWEEGYVWAFKKSLVNETSSGTSLLNTSSSIWKDEKINMGYVGFDEFEFRIKASKGKLELQLNNESPYIYEDISLAKWPFENYFKAGNYLQTTNLEAFAKVKYYSLTITH